SFHLASRYFSSLSDGEKQKIMFSRCLAQDTPVILMDEPLAFLDYPSRVAMLNMLKEIAKSMGKIILFSSHDLEISLPFCNQLLILNADASWKWISDPNEIRNLSPKDIF
ncbi:MAG: ATP-binding cassette domain-containing protein, partial [Bacteroidia bacterium]|nr:ATP-binding cassette domain-containing protein [Bacteroidia bacterium]